MTRYKHARIIWGLFIGILSLALAWTAGAQEASTAQRERTPARPLPAQHLFIFKKGEMQMSSATWHEGVEIVAFELEGVPNLTSFGSHIYFAGQPEAAALKTFADRGVKTVINLRTAQEMDALDFDEAASVKAAGMEYLQVPMGRDPLSEADLKRIAVVLDGAGESPVLLHCRSSNRVGLVWSMFRSDVHGLGMEAAIQEGRDAGMTVPRLEERAREYIKSQSNQ